MSGATRTVVCADALPWLAGRAGTLDGVVTSPPDASEVGMALDVWAPWFAAVAVACFEAVRGHGPAVFFVTDRKAGGMLHSKAHILMDAAVRTGHRLRWHKVVLRRPVGSTDLHRPGYSHLLAFSRSAGPGAATPDVIDGGLRVYANGMPYNAARVAVAHAAGWAGHITDPFCGRGTVLAMANHLGLPATGVDIDPLQCQAARALDLGGTYTGI